MEVASEGHSKELCSSLVHHLSHHSKGIQRSFVLVLFIIFLTIQRAFKGAFYPSLVLVVVV
ncbi:hypothetical protein Hdeb2414_s0012g00386241 [Helianthus debilis subsp. tardiflorus]